MLTLSKELIMQHIDKGGMDAFLPENPAQKFTSEHIATIVETLGTESYGIKLVHIYGDDGCTFMSKDFLNFSFKCMDVNETSPTTKEYPTGEVPNISEVLGTKTKTHYVDILTGKNSIMKGKKTTHLTQRELHTGQLELINHTSEVFTMFREEKEIVIALIKEYESTRIFTERSATSTAPSYSLHMYLPSEQVQVFETESEEN